jgi:hypothetical protein
MMITYLGPTLAMLPWFLILPVTMVAHREK